MNILKQHSHKLRIRMACIALLLLSTAVQAQVLHDIAQGNLEIAAASTDDYVVTGKTTQYHVAIQPGYTGTITLRNLTITLNGSVSPITLHGDANASNLQPISNVNIVLEGANRLEYTGRVGAAALQVDYGTQINISAIDPRDNASGTLTAWQSRVEGGAAIGARNAMFSGADTETQVAISLQGTNNGQAILAGGNIVIASGTITARGGHGAGIGGGYLTFYDGMIVIYGGVVNASCMRHAAGIGSGCPTGFGIIKVAAPHSAIIALPPAKITAAGAGEVPYIPIPDYALAGSNNIVYIGDPKKPLVTVHTEDYEPYADIYADLSQNEEIANVIRMTVPPEKLDLNKIHFGTTNAAGRFTFRGVLQDNTTFFTDAFSSQPDTYGRPYTPTTTALTSGGTVVLDLLPIDLQWERFPATVLMEHYSPQQAKDSAFCAKLTYNDAIPMTHLQIDLAKGTDTDFKDIIFLAADSVTPVAMPAELQQGDVYYMIVPIQNDKEIGVYGDVLRLTGDTSCVSTGYIRSVVKQAVGVITAELCEGETYTFDGQVYQQTGNYDIPYIDSRGNESVVRLELTVYPTYHHHETLTLCQDELPYTWRDTTFEVGTTSGTHTFERTTIHGCDSLVTLTLTVHPSYIEDQHLTLCSSELPYTWRDVVLEAGKQTGQYTFKRQTIHGCDSIVNLHLTVHPAYDNTEDLTLCRSELPYTWRDTTFEVGTMSGRYTRYHTTVHGCDSILRLNLIVNDTSIVHIYDSVYIDSTYHQHGFTYKAIEEVDYAELTQNLSTIHGCDSTVHLHLRVLGAPFVAYIPAIDTICADQTAFEVPFLYEYVLYPPNLIEVVFSNTALQAGFTHHATTDDIGYVTIDLPDHVVPNIYHATLCLRFNQFTQALPFIFTVQYPSSIIQQHWNDLLALQNETLNGGFLFEEYQWYKNGQPLAEENKSYLYLGPNDVLDMTAEYAVEIRRAGEQAKILTCPITPIPHTDVQAYPTLVEASSQLKMPIQRTTNIAIYTIDGRLLMRTRLTPEANTILAPSTIGLYVVQLMENGKPNVTYKMMVQ